MSKNKLRKRRKSTRVSIDQNVVQFSVINKFLNDLEKATKVGISSAHIFMARRENIRENALNNFNEAVHKWASSLQRK